MNILKNNMFSQPIMPTNPQLQQALNQVKQIKQMCNGNISALANQNPQIAQLLQATKGQNTKTIFYSMCKQQNINPNDILNVLK